MEKQKATLLTETQVAERLGVSPLHVLRMARTGVLHPVVRDGQKLQFLPREVARYEKLMAEIPLLAPGGTEDEAGVGAMWALALGISIAAAAGLVALWGLK